MGPIIPSSLADLLNNTSGRGDVGSGGIATADKRKSSTTGGGGCEYGGALQCAPARPVP